MNVKGFRRWALLLLVAVAVAVPVAAAIPFAWDWLEDASRAEAMPSRAPDKRDPFFNSPYIVAGSMKPQVVPGFEAKIDDAEEVIGVEVREHHRAYWVKAFKKPPFVVNDVVDRSPVTVTYCSHTRYSQAFTGPRTNEPMEIWLGGWIDGSMILKLDQDFFMQSTGENLNGRAANKQVVPILPHQRVTWKTWRESHPDTDICMDY